LRGYLAAVQDAALEDVQAAIQRFIRGEAKVDNAQFCPSSAQLSIEVRERRLMRELLVKRTLSGAPVPRPRNARWRGKAATERGNAADNDRQVGARPPSLSCRTSPPCG
jgi:hypothetical protein